MLWVGDKLVEGIREEKFEAPQMNRKRYREASPGHNGVLVHTMNGRGPSHCALNGLQQRRLASLGSDGPALA